MSLRCVHCDHFYQSEETTPFCSGCAAVRSPHVPTPSEGLLVSFGVPIRPYDVEWVSLPTGATFTPTTYAIGTFLTNAFVAGGVWRRRMMCAAVGLQSILPYDAIYTIMVDHNRTVDQ